MVLKNVTEEESPLVEIGERPIANLAFFEGVGSMAIIMKRLVKNVVAHLSWETDYITVDFLASRFRVQYPCGMQEGLQLRRSRKCWKDCCYQRTHWW